MKTWNKWLPNQARFLHRAYSVSLFAVAFVPRAIYPVSRPLEWYTRSLQFISAVLRADWGATYLKEHPGVFPMWLAGIGLATRRLLRGESLIVLESSQALEGMVTPADIAAAVLPLALVIALQITIVYLLLRRLTTSAVVPVVGSAWLALDPFHIANSKALLLDALLSTTMLVSALFGLAYVILGWQRRDLLASGLFCGLALLTKMPAVLLVPWFGLVLLGGWWAGKASAGSRSLLRRVVAPSLLWGGVALLVFVILWPSMWARPRLTLEAMQHAAASYAGSPHNHPNYFMGQIVTTDQGPWFYPVVLLVESTFLTLSFFVIALLLLYKGWKQWRREAAIATSLLVYAVLYGFQMTLGAKKGVRYVLPLLPAMDVVAAFGIAWWHRCLPRLLQGEWMIRTLASIAVLGQTLISLPQHPYYAVRDNLLLGGHQVGRRLVAPMDQGEGLDLAAAYLNGLADSSALRAGAQMAISFRRYFDGETVEFTDPNADYLVFAQNTVTRRLGVEEWQGLWDIYKFATPVHQVVLNGVTYAWVYSTADIHELEIEDIGYRREAYVGHVAMYLGYDIFPQHDVSPGGVWELRLAWQAREVADTNYSVFVHLIDDAGRLVAQQDNWPVRGTRPTVTWKPDQIIADFYDLPVPLDTPPGSYRVYAGIYDASTGERLPVEVDGVLQPDARLEICTVNVIRLLPSWVVILDLVWFGALLALPLLARVRKRKPFRSRVNGK